MLKKKQTSSSPIQGGCECRPWSKNSTLLQMNADCKTGTLTFSLQLAEKKRVETCFSWWIEVFPGAETTIKLLCVSNSKVSNFLTELTEQHIVKSGITLRCKATQNCQKLTNLYIEPNYNIIKRCKMNKFIRIIDLWKKEAK